MDYEEKARELMDFHMKTKESEMSNRLHKMAHGENIMLECIAHCENGIMPNEIARDAGGSAARVAAFLKAVEKKGYIERKNYEGDRRKINIVLTDIGWNKVNEKRQEMLKRTAWYLEQLGEKDTEELLRILKKSREIMEKEREKKGKQ